MIQIDTAVENPFPGLPRFEPHQAKYFYGRAKQVQQMLRHLEAQRFLVVIGSSGCGKSSLVRAGLLPALLRGYLGSGPNWRIALMTPGTRPCAALAQALAVPECMNTDSELIETTLRESTLGLVEVARRNHLAGQNLLVVVDQFEEIFRFREISDFAEAEAAHFVQLLLQASARGDDELRIVLTMRTDYLTDCAQFDGLPEAMNKGQFLVPRLTREERQEAIQRPLDFVGVEYTARLVQRVLNDAGDDPTNLPVLQHALRRTFEHWRGVGSTGPIDIADYEAATTGGSAIEKHAEGVYARLSPAERSIAEKVFRVLTTLDRGGRVRRPSTIGHIQAVTGGGDAVRSVIGRFAEQGFLTLNEDEAVDLTHESVIERWPRLKSWVDTEQKSADWYWQIVDSVRYKRSLWKGAELRAAERLRDKDGWNQAWADQYAPGFDEAMQFLRRSRWRRRFVFIGWLSLIMAIVLFALVFTYKLNEQRIRAQKGEVRAFQAELEAKKARDSAEASASRARAAIASTEEERQRHLADAAKFQQSSEAYTKQLRELTSGNTQRLPEETANVAALREKLASAERDRDTYQSRLSDQKKDYESQIATLNKELNKLRGEVRQNASEQGPIPPKAQPSVDILGSVLSQKEVSDAFGKAVGANYWAIEVKLANNTARDFAIEGLVLETSDGTTLPFTPPQDVRKIATKNRSSFGQFTRATDFLIHPNSSQLTVLFLQKSLLHLSQGQLPPGTHVKVVGSTPISEKDLVPNFTIIASAPSLSVAQGNQGNVRGHDGDQRRLQ